MVQLFQSIVPSGVSLVSIHGVGLGLSKVLSPSSFWK